jgi:hypothetical protein
MTVCSKKLHALAMLVFLLAVFDVMAGCDNGAADINRFIGTWEVTEGEGRLKCPQVERTIELSTMITFASGAESDLVTQRGCTLLLDVAGGTATALPGQTCQLDNAKLENVTWQISLSSANDVNATATGSATSTVTVGPLSANCTYEENATLRKISN